MAVLNGVHVTMTETLVRKLPKAELHIHIEGSLEPSMMLQIAERNNLTHLLPFKTLEEAQAAYNFGCLQDFLDLYFLGCKVLVEERDFYDLMWAYLESAKRDNIVHAEIFFDPQSHTERGVSFETCFQGLYKATQDAKQKLGIDASLIFCFLRHLGVEKAWETLKQAIPYKDRIPAVGLSSTELGNPNIAYKDVYAAAIDAGFIPVAHAGEEGDAQNIWDTINHLKVRRIDHGVHCVDDPALIKHLEGTQLPLTVCPLSNQKLKVYGGSPHVEKKLAELLSHRCCVTFNSDDPAYFGGYINTAFAGIAETLKMQPKDVHRIVTNSFVASFITDEQRKQWVSEVDRVYEEVTGEKP